MILSFVCKANLDSQFGQISLHSQHSILSESSQEDVSQEFYESRNILNLAGRNFIPATSILNHQEVLFRENHLLELPRAEIIDIVSPSKKHNFDFQFRTKNNFV